MAIPNGSGSEILWAGTIHAQSTDPTAFKWDGTNPTVGDDTYTVPALHIITLVSIVFCENGNAAEEIYIQTNNGSNAIYLGYKIPIGANETFVWNDKVVFTPGEKCVIFTEAAANIDIRYSFIDQDWTNP